MECGYAEYTGNRNGSVCGTALDAMYGAKYYAPFFQVHLIARSQVHSTPSSQAHSIPCSGALDFKLVSAPQKCPHSKNTKWPPLETSLVNSQSESATS